MSYLIDVQGTLIDDENKKPIEGAIDFINALNQAKIPYVVVTNNTKLTSEAFYKFLVDLGFDIPKENYLDPFMSLEKILNTHETLCFGADEFLHVMTTLGYELQAKKPKAVVIASKKDFSADEYALMIESVLDGARLVGMHATSIYKKDKRRYPGVGAILEMVSYATGAKYEVVGKPSSLFYAQAKELLKSQGWIPSQGKPIMISDDAIGDLVGAKQEDIKTILVLSGKCKTEKEVLHVRTMLDCIVPSIKDVKVTKNG
ncbi:MAG: HAD-IIA family hydrolase [Sulfurospirillaceae bacterium]|nr:HAD-IIA family hydrolase [Sulfurospirillaceae bacterium]